MKIYLDTNVYSMLQDGSSSKKIIEKVYKCINDHSMIVVTSTVLFHELSKTPEKKIQLILNSLKTIKRDDFFKEDVFVKSLADLYIILGCVPFKSRNDARHVATATLAGCDFIVSNNQKHFLKKRDSFFKANKKLNLKTPEIVTPLDFLEKWPKKKKKH